MIICWGYWGVWTQMVGGAEIEGVMNVWMLRIGSVRKGKVTARAWNRYLLL